MVEMEINNKSHIRKSRTRYKETGVPLTGWCRTDVFDFGANTSFVRGV
jgi:hypothetical protein